MREIRVSIGGGVRAGGSLGGVWLAGELQELPLIVPNNWRLWSFLYGRFCARYRSAESVGEAWKRRSSTTLPRGVIRLHLYSEPLGFAKVYR